MGPNPAGRASADDPDVPSPDHPDAAAVDHYFTADPHGPSEVRTVDVALPDVAFTMATDRGVFSHGHLDTGTGVLLRAPIVVPDQGHLLDLGCGAGPIALALAKRAPAATVWAVDVNARARDLCRENVRRNRLSNVRVVAPEDVADDVVFAAIWSNPPIRIGKAALHELLDRWLERLEEHVGDRGTAALVVQKHLGADSLQRWLDRSGYHTERRTSKAGFRVLVVHR